MTTPPSPHDRLRVNVVPFGQATNHGYSRSALVSARTAALGLLEDRSGRTSPLPLGGERFRVVVVRPRLLLDEISLTHWVPPSKIDAGGEDAASGPFDWGLRATAYRMYLRRLALFRLVKSEA
jgi:hypothetical protein